MKLMGFVAILWPKKRKRHGKMSSIGIMPSMGDKQWKVIKDSYITFFQSNNRERERERVIAQKDSSSIYAIAFNTTMKQEVDRRLSIWPVHGVHFGREMPPVLTAD